jgi:hypothetical protein
MDLQEAFDTGFVAVKAYVDDALAAQRGAIPDLIKAAVAEAMAERPEPKAGADGKDAPPVTLEQLGDVVRGYLEANPPAAGRDGADGKDGEQGPQGEKGEPGEAGRDGTDGLAGKDAEPLSEAQIAVALSRHFEANPPAAGKDGRDGVDGKDGRDGIDGEKGLDGAEGPVGAQGADGQRGVDGKDGRDGCDVTEAMIDRDGNLVVVFSDGRSKALGLVVGRDGVDGSKGEAGRDGLTVTDFATDLSEDGRFLTLSLENEQTKVAHTLQLPTMIYRGGYKEGVEYVEGDTVTFGGSLWCCSAPTTEKPIEGRDCWRLAARKGRDGKDAKP